MIKTNAVEQVPDAVEQSYPCLKRDGEKGIIVFFSRESCGVVIQVAKGIGWSVGRRSGSWDMAKFKPWYGTVGITCIKDNGAAIG